MSRLAWIVAAAVAVTATAFAATPLLERDATNEAEGRLATALNAASADVARALADARVRVVALATSPIVQRALVSRDADAIRAVERRDPQASITFGDSRPPAAPSAAVVTGVVKDGDKVIGRVHVAVPLAPVVASAARRAGVELLVVRDGRIASRGARAQRLRVPIGEPVDVQVARTRYRALGARLGGDAGNAVLVGLVSRASITATARSRRNLVLAVVFVALGAILLAGSAAQRMQRVPRQTPPQRAHRISAREALALVGDALAATHEPRALLSVILTTAVEATGAAGGRLLDEGVEVARVGTAPDVDPLDVELTAGASRGLLRLFPPPEGFSAEDIVVARSLASQASIAIENAHLHRLVERQAATDHLTELANRRTFTDALDAELRRSARSRDPFGLVIADLDDFKRVNDSYGHTIGDRVLAGFARVVERELRDIDIAARIGGEEFALLLPATDTSGAAAVAERLRAAVAATEFDVGGDALHITASFGVTAYTPDSSAEQLLVIADRALYAAKAAGKDRVVAVEADAAEGERDPVS